MDKLNEAKLAQERLLLSSQLEAKQEKNCLEKINKKYQKSKAANIVLKDKAIADQGARSSYQCSASE